MVHSLWFPLKKEGYTLSIDGNGFEGVDCPRYRCCGLSFAYYYMWEMTDEDHFVTLYHSLREYALTLSERSFIFSAID